MVLNCHAVLLRLSIPTYCILVNHYRTLGKVCQLIAVDFFSYLYCTLHMNALHAIFMAM